MKKSRRPIMVFNFVKMTTNESLRTLFYMLYNFNLLITITPGISKELS